MVEEREKMVKSLIFNTNPVLPTVYSDTLSYYEELNKVVQKMNEIIGDINNNFTNYIDEYFKGIIANAVYNESTETIVLSKELSIVGDVHTYDVNTNTLGVS